MLAATALVLGLLLPPDEPQAEAIREGVTAAVQEANRGTGRVVVLKVRGRKGPWGSDASEAARLVEDDRASALVAPPSGAATHLVLQVAGRTGVPVATLCPDSSVTKTAVPWVVRVVPTTADEARAIFRKEPASRWLALVPEGRSGREVARDLETAAAGSTTVICEKVSSELRPILTRVKPDGILIWLDPASEKKLAQALREAGYSGFLAGPVRRASPPVTSYAHDAAALLIGILRGSHSAEPRRAFPLKGSFSGATGPMAFDSNGNRLRS